MGHCFAFRSNQPESRKTMIHALGRHRDTFSIFDVQEKGDDVGIQRMRSTFMHSSHSTGRQSPTYQPSIVRTKPLPFASLVNVTSKMAA